MPKLSAMSSALRAEAYLPHTRSGYEPNGSGEAAALGGASSGLVPVRGAPTATNQLVAQGLIPVMRTWPKNPVRANGAAAWLNSASPRPKGKPAFRYLSRTKSTPSASETELVNWTTVKFSVLRATTARLLAGGRGRSAGTGRGQLRIADGWCRPGHSDGVTLGDGRPTEGGAEV